MNAGPSASPQATSLFDTIVIVDELTEATQLNATLRDMILARQAAAPGVNMSNVGGWQSDANMLDWGGEAAQQLIERIIAVADQFTVDVRSPNMPRHRWAANMWGNVSPPQASNQLHTHPGAFWSAVYYVDDGYAGSEDRTLGGELVLQDPRMPMIMMHMPNLRVRWPDGRTDEPQLAMRPKAGRIVMFPAWLHHGVLPYLGKATRISIAANLTAEPRDASG